MSENERLEQIHFIYYIDDIHQSLKHEVTNDQRGNLKADLHNPELPAWKQINAHIMVISATSF